MLPSRLLWGGRCWMWFAIGAFMLVFGIVYEDSFACHCHHSPSLDEKCRKSREPTLNDCFPRRLAASQKLHRRAPKPEPMKCITCITTDEIQLRQNTHTHTYIYIYIYIYIYMHTSQRRGARQAPSPLSTQFLQRKLTERPTPMSQCTAYSLESVPSKGCGYTDWRLQRWTHTRTHMHTHTHTHPPARHE